LASKGLFLVVILSGARASTAVNIAPQGTIEGDFEKYAVIRDGTTYTITPDRSGACQIGDGELFARPGSIVAKDQESYLVVTPEKSRNARYLDLAAGELKGEPVGHRAAFASWTLHDDAAIPHDPRRTLMHHDEPSSND
jgi:hypothetical protein